MQNSDINHPLLKLVSVLLAWFASVNWGNVATFVAALYTMLLIAEFVWRKIFRPIKLWYKDRRRPMLFPDTDKVDL